MQHAAKSMKNKFFFIIFIFILYIIILKPLFLWRRVIVVMS